MCKRWKSEERRKGWQSKGGGTSERERERSRARESGREGKIGTRRRSDTEVREEKSRKKNGGECKLQPWTLTLNTERYSIRRNSRHRTHRRHHKHHHTLCHTAVTDNPLKETCACRTIPQDRHTERARTFADEHSPAPCLSHDSHEFAARCSIYLHHSLPSPS